MVEKKSKEKVEGMLKKEISRRDFIKTTAVSYKRPNSVIRYWVRDY